ncbi:hypothetical protein SEA_FLOWERPOWER_80 [Streptomyces phage FlowerPower]|uniref:Uncharacterized protein n=1 Tax=Streptomyces phage FlowerPower TaxID=2182408 RepID=A0A2U8UNV9_9CAUD|nr:hypothetical protein HWB61_gp21 [Streptomyces phage FlowerPower]AWN05161.1 hypothetical protein SEA_FLOWERPOWER_80 [Streptomyces phage FlowerPower]
MGLRAQRFLIQRMDHKGEGLHMLTKRIAVVTGGILLSILGTACTAPSGGGEECEWELKKRSQSHSLTLVSSTRTYLTGTRPAPRPAPAPAPRINTVKPKPGSKPAVRVVPPPKPTKPAPAGKVWVLDCD